MSNVCLTCMPAGQFVNPDSWMLVKSLLWPVNNNLCLSDTAISLEYGWTLQVHTSAAGRRKLNSISVHVVSDVSMTTQLAILMSFNVKQLLVLQTPYRLHDWDAVYVPASTRKENTTPFGVNLMRSQVLYRAAQGLKDVEVVLARPVVPPVSSSLQCISAVVL